jgi:TatA/E family protein of Tat protein translocase
LTGAASQVELKVSTSPDKPFDPGLRLRRFAFLPATRLSGTHTMFGMGPMELLIVLVVALLLFGNRLPSVARSLGRSMVEFKKGMNEVDDTKSVEDRRDR